MFQEEQVPNVKTETLNEIVCEEGKHPHVCGDVPENSSLGPKDGTVHYFAGVELSKLSKTQRKKYLRLQKWLLKKKERRERERLISKNRKAEAKLHNIDLGPSSKMLKSNRMCDSPCKITVAIDLSFDELMIPKDLGKMIKQILRIYTVNRRAAAPMQLYLTNFEGLCKDEMSKHIGYENWDINMRSESYLKIFRFNKLVYLTSESPNIITELQDEKVYVIGGLVDHNSHKGVCYKKALEQGIEHAQLPIKKHFHLQTRNVFTINQVFEILLKVSEGTSFREAFEMVLPKRFKMKSVNTSTDVIDETMEDTAAI